VVDGRTIAFVSERFDRQAEIMAFDFSSRTLTRLTDNAARDDQPKWSPDGKKLAFVSDRDGNQDIFIMSADGSGLLNLSRKYGLPGTRPAWSPDGKRIVIDSWAYPGERNR
jgi:Tol biopolymer transport system component